MGKNTNKEFEFSIIMATYNSQRYLCESIDSIIKQNIGFENNVQLILVDDGSTDNSNEICLMYQKEYPNNIVLISKDNEGPASARNEGLKYASGKYINFLDSDDILSLNSLKDVRKFFIKNKEIDVVAIPMEIFDGEEKEHDLNFKFEKNKVIDLKKEFNSPQLHISSSFLRKESLNNYKFETNLINMEGALLINKIILNKQKYGVIKSPQYFFRKRPDNSSIMDISPKSKRAFTEKIKNFYLNLIEFSFSTKGSVPKFIKYLILYDLNDMVKSKNFRNIFDTESEIDEFWKYFLEVLSYMDEELINNHEFIDNDIKSFLIFLKNNDFHIIERPKRNKLFLKSNEYIINKLHNHKIRFDIVELKNNKLLLSGLFVSNCYPDLLQIKAIKRHNGKNSEYIAKYVDYPTTYRKTSNYLGIDWKFFYNFDLSIDIGDYEESEIKIQLVYEGIEKVVMYPKIKFRPYTNISDLSNYFYCDNKIVKFQNKRFYIFNLTKELLLKSELKSSYNIFVSMEEFFLQSLFIRLICLLLHPIFKNKKIWLFMDRPDVADDNAKHLFEYSVKQNDNIKKYFIIDKNSKDYSKISKISKNIIHFGSLKHKIYYIFSDKIISSHVNHEWLNPFYYINQKLYSGLTTTKKCFLQHGVIKDDLSDWLRKFYHNLHLFLTLSEYEKDSIINGNYNYDDEVVQLLGLPRYDKLKGNNTKKEILFMPTWRKYLKNESQFKNSDYFISLNNFLNNEKLIKFLKENDYKIIFKPHYDLLPYLDLFNLSSQVQITMERSYQDLINNSSLMITDYSSVFFDYAYVKKPIFYYHASEYHYIKGYFDYETMGFGDVIDNEYELVDKVINCIQNNCIMEEKYKKRVSDFFEFNDKNNCKRVYEWLYSH